jgi:hypothetical protein
VPLVDDIKRSLSRKPTEASADAGYLSEANLAALAYRNISAYIATGRAKHPSDTKREITGPLTRAMRDKRSSAHDGAAATDCENRSSNRCSDRSSRPGGSDSSCCAASTR